MKIRHALPVILSLLVPTAVASCGGSDDTTEPPGGTAGSAGAAAGNGGGAGAAGQTAGKGGAAGAGGAGGAGAGGAGAGGAGAGGATGGSGGSSGGGTAGTAGTAGAAGTAGTAGGGAGGAAGMAGGGAGGSSPCVDDDYIPPSDVAPTTLSAAGLYTNVKTGALHPDVKVFQPKFVLWSDNASKQRWVYIPKCSKIDTTDMDHWVFPVGTRLFKEFSRDGKRIETRLSHKYGPGQDDWLLVTYQWRADLSDADLADKAGVQNAGGTQHDIPSQVQCVTCHSKLSERGLGFSAIQLSHDLPGETMKSLSAAGKLTAAAPAGFKVPGDDVTVAAAGYLHANCGNCHNATGVPTDLRMRILTTAATVADLDLIKTAVGKVPNNFTAPGVTNIVKAGDPAASAIYYRMSHRNDATMSNVQMPPIGTEVVDDKGVKTITDWIKALP